MRALTVYLLVGGCTHLAVLTGQLAPAKCTNIRQTPAPTPSPQTYAHVFGDVVPTRFRFRNMYAQVHIRGRQCHVLYTPPSARKTHTSGGTLEMTLPRTEWDSLVHSVRGFYYSLPALQQGARLWRGRSNPRPAVYGLQAAVGLCPYTRQCTAAECSSPTARHRFMGPPGNSISLRCRRTSTASCTKPMHGVDGGFY
jgi:hypothetical protein